MGLIESGTFNSYPAVDKCSAHPSLAQIWGIHSPSKMTTISGEIDTTVIPPVIIGNTEWRLYRHPDLLIPQTCLQWKPEYNHKTKYGSRIEYDDFNPCYIYAEQIYENYRGKE